MKASSKMHPCPTCGEPLVSTAAIDPERPRRIWRCVGLHGVWLDDAAAPPEPPAAGQLELL